MEMLAKMSTAATLEMLGLLTLRYGLVLILFWIGAMKFTAFEAEGIKPLIGTSPFLRWLYRAFDPQTVSNLLGTAEITAGMMIALRPYSARLAAFGSAFAAIMFLTTFSFLFSLPGWEPTLGGFPALSSAGGFLVKDICLLGVALWSLGEALISVKSGAINSFREFVTFKSARGDNHA
jgi:reactive chlorine resistance protein C